jgi:hypothetical protein
MDPNVVMNRLIRLAKLDTTVFDEVRDDERELVPAVIIAVVCAFLAGLGALLWSKVAPDVDFNNAVVNQFILGSIFLAVLYGVAALVVYVVMAQMYRIQADLMAIVRTMGYAALPLALCVLMFIPLIFPLFAIVPLALLYVMMIYAVQSATGADSEQVVIAVTIGFSVMVLVLGIIAVSTSLGDAPMGAGLFGILFDFN